MKTEIITRRDIFMKAVERAWDHPTMSETGKMAAIILAFETSKMQAECIGGAYPSSVVLDRHPENQRIRSRILSAIISAAEFARGYRGWLGLPNLLDKLQVAGLAVANRSPSELEPIMIELKAIPSAGSNLELMVKAIHIEASQWISEPVSTSTRFGLWYLEHVSDRDSDWSLMRELVRVIGKAREQADSDSAMRLRGVE